MSKRKNITVSDTVAKWYEDRSELTGLSQSAIMGMALTEYMEMQDIPKSVISIDDFLKRLEQLKG